MHHYQNVSYGGESLTLENSKIRIDFHKRLTGWGWAEIFTPQGKFMGVLDHFGEIMLRDQEMPIRMEAQEVRIEKGDFGQRLVCDVEATMVQKKLKGTSFENWIEYPFKDPVAVGQVAMTLADDDAALKIDFNFVSRGNLFVRYVRGPWLKAGVDAYGVDKFDAIFPGVEWLIDDEWSSGTDWFKDPWAQRFVPHPNKVSIPVMATSHEGVGIGLSWDPNARSSQWFSYKNHHAQPVFAVPNFIDRKNNQLMGLMIPEVEIEAQENQIYAEPPMELHLDQRISFAAEVFICEGTSLDVIKTWIDRHGMTPPPEPRWPLEQALERIARAYNDRFWKEGQGFGNEQHPENYRPHAPSFAVPYLQEFCSDEQLKRELQAKLDWCKAQPGKGNKKGGAHGKEGLLEQGRELMTHQREDGSFAFEPDGRHYRKDDFVVAREYLEPMGLDGDTALAITIEPAAELLRIAKETGDETIREGARKALESCMDLHRPEGGDFWETPLHAPNLLAAGLAAVAYYQAYEYFGDERYKAKAIHWIRSLLPFTHLWTPGDKQMMYNTKPCLCSSDWYFANWVRDHVQWEVLRTFAMSIHAGIRWSEIDPEVDWDTYHEGITVAALRWMIDHKDDNWHPHNLPDTYELYLKGVLDDNYADTHNSTTGHYGGMIIPPDPIAVNLIGVLRIKREK